MIIVDEKAEKPGLSPTPRSPASYYASPSPQYHARSASSAASSSGASSTLRPPPSWPASSSETTLSLAGSPYPSFPALTATHSADTYLPAKPAEAPSLTRLVPPNLPRKPFQPMFLIAEGNSLKQGFPVVLPPTSHTPHPFSWCDVNETDWTQCGFILFCSACLLCKFLRFLEEMRAVARLTNKEKNMGYTIPILSAIPYISAYTFIQTVNIDFILDVC